MPNVLITNQGLNFVSSASDVGVFISLKYFIPVYDDRIDPTVRSSSNLSAFTDIADATATEPYGEKIWKRIHTLSNAGTYLISAVPFADNKLTNTYQQASVQTNLYNGTPLSDQVSGTWINYLSATNGLYTWSATDGDGINGDDTDPGGAAFSQYGEMRDYYASYDTSALNRLRGSFKYFIGSEFGNIKFNKIAMYAILVDAQGNSATDISFFGEAYLSNAAVRSNIGLGFDQFEIDVQLDLSGVSATFDELFFASSADHWSHSPGGLYYPGKVGVGSFVDNQKEISASMHVRRSRDLSGVIDSTIPQLRIDQDNEKFWTIEALSTQYNVNHQDGDADKTGGDLEIAVGRWTNFCGDAVDISPKIPSSVTLGANNTFRALYLYYPSQNDDSDDILEEPYLLSVENSNGGAIDINDGNIKIGFINLTGYSNLDGIRMNNLRMEIFDDGDNYLYGHYKGGDLVRDSENLLIYNTYCNYTDGPMDYGVENIYMFAGLDLSSTYVTGLGQTGPTHRNILYEIEKGNDNLFCGKNNNLASTAELHLAAKGKIGLHGPIEIQNLSEYADTDSLANAIMISRETELKMMIGAGINDSVTFNTLSDRMAALQPMTGLVNESSRLFLIAANTFVDGNIIPLRDETHDIGSISKRFDIGYFNAGNFYCVQSTDGYYERNRTHALGEWVYGDTDTVYSNVSTSNYLVDLYSEETSLGIEVGDVLTVSAIKADSEVNSSSNLIVNSTTTIQDLLDTIEDAFEANAEIDSVTASLTNDSRILIEIESVDNDNDNVIVSITNGGSDITKFPYGNFGVNGSKIGSVLKVILSVNQAYTIIGKTCFVRGSFATSGAVSSYSFNLPSILQRKVFTNNLGFFQGSVYPESNLADVDLFKIYPLGESETVGLEAAGSFQAGQTYYYSVVYESLF